MPPRAEVRACAGPVHACAVSAAPSTPAPVYAFDACSRLQAGPEEIVSDAYITAYTWFDNTPEGSPDIRTR